MFKHKLFMTCAAVALGLGASARAFAQSEVASVPTGVTSGGTIEEVVVTAEKRDSTVQHTALVVDVLNPETLKAAGVNDFTTLSKVDPSIQVTGGIGSTVISVNGVRPYNISPVTQSPIAVDLDGAYLARLTGLTGYFYDLQRIEVLDGPQGTLYGRNATAGVVNINTQKPKTTFGGYLEVEGGNYNEARVEGALNLPVNDTLDVRVAGREYQHAGYFSNGLSNANENGGRISVLWRITPQAKFYASADYESQQDDNIGTGVVGSTLKCANSLCTGNLIPGPNVPVPSNPFTSTQNLYPNGPGPSVNLSRVWGSQAQLDYDLTFATLTAQVANRRVSTFATFDSQPSIVVNGTNGGTQNFPGRSNTFSGELRLTSAPNQPLQWVGGFYAFHEDAYGMNCVLTSFAVPFPATAETSGCTVGSPLTDGSTSYALFGQATYSVPKIEQLKIIVGGRYNYDIVDGSSNEYAVFYKAPIDNPSLHHEGGATTYKVGLSYDVTPVNLLYATMSTGYRAFNYQYGFTPYVPAETNTAYEIGSKNQFFNRKLQFNVDAFEYIYKGSERSVQTYPPIPQLPFGSIDTISAGKLRFLGMNISGILAITSNDRINMNVQLLDAKYINFVEPTIYKNTTPFNLAGIPTGQPSGVYSGDEVGGTQPLSGNAGYEHSWDVFGGTLAGDINAQFATATHMQDADPGTIEDVIRPAYVVGDMQVRFAPAGNMWTISAWVLNFTNKAVWNTATWNSNGLITATLQDPRTFGVTLSAKFGGG